MTLAEIYNKIYSGGYKNDDSLMFADLEPCCGTDVLPDEIKGSINYLAYEQGHSSGLQDICSFYLELAPIVLKTYQFGLENSKK